MHIFEEFYSFNEKMLLSLPFDRKPTLAIAKEYPYVSKKLAGQKLLKGEREAFLNEYIAYIGKSNTLSQTEFLTEHKQQFKKYVEETKEEYRKYGSLYIKIFFLVGVLFALVFA